MFVFLFSSVGIENPTIEVRFENLEIKAEVFVGSNAVPTVINFFVNKIEVHRFLFMRYCKQKVNKC